MAVAAGATQVVPMGRKGKAGQKVSLYFALSCTAKSSPKSGNQLRDGQKLDASKVPNLSYVYLSYGIVASDLCKVRVLCPQRQEQSGLVRIPIYSNSDGRDGTRASGPVLYAQGAASVRNEKMESRLSCPGVGG